jgi:serine/threonine protein kinase
MQSKEVFKLEKMLGVGSFGTTYRAFVTDEKLRRKWGDLVVIKIPHNKEKEKTLLQEFNINYRLSELNCENLVQYLGFEKFDDKYVMVMEFVDGESLRDLVGEIGHQHKLGVEETLGYIKQILKGLIEIHSCHIFHRDIKPDNILIARPSGIVKISDFGISTAIKSSELASTTSGTIVYMPKEILEGEGGAFYSDIYSLGVTFYEMITGRLPFEGVSYTELINNICHSEPAEPKKINNEINDRLNAIVMKALSKDIKERYKSAQEVLQEIQRYEMGADFEIGEAWDLFHQGKITLAGKKLHQLVKNEPNNPKVYLNLGDFYNNCQRHKEAIETYKKGIEKNPDFSLLYNHIALSLFQEGAKNQAIEYLNKAIELGLGEKLEKIARIILGKWKNNN